MYARKPYASEDAVRTSVCSDGVRFLSFPVPKTVRGDIAQLARAPALQAGCQGFKSPYLHINLSLTIFKEDMLFENIGKGRRFERWSGWKL